MNTSKHVAALLLANASKKRPSVGRGTRKKPTDEMNKTEAAYAMYLLGRADVEWFAFEPIKLQLAKRTWYTPDFLVLLTDGSLEIHEVKGHWEDDARVKIKVAAQMFPFRFLAVKKDGNNWSFETL